MSRAKLRGKIKGEFASKNSPAFQVQSEDSHLKGFILGGDFKNKNSGMKHERNQPRPFPAMTLENRPKARNNLNRSQRQKRGFKEK